MMSGNNSKYFSRQFSKKILAIAAVAAIVPAMHASTASASIADLYSGGAGTYTETGTVSAILNVNGTSNTFVIQDATGGTIAYGIPLATYTATVGDALNFTAYNSVYQGSPEIVNSGGSPTATVFTVNSVAAGTAPAPTVMSIADFNATGDGATAGLPPYAETIVELDNVTLSPTTAMPGSTGNETYTLSDGSSTTSMYAYKSDSAVVAAEEAANAANPTGFNGVYDIVGYADEYYGKAEIYPLSITAVPEPASLGLLAIGGISLLVRRRREV